MVSEPIYCSAQTYHATRDNPAEWCEELVDEHGDLCPIHEEADRADADYDNYLESLRED